MTQSNTNVYVRVEIRNAHTGQPLMRYIGSGGPGGAREYAPSYLYDGTDIAGAALWFDGTYPPEPDRRHAIVVNGHDVTGGAHPLLIAAGLRLGASIAKGQSVDLTDSLRAYMAATAIGDVDVAMDDVTEWVLNAGLAVGHGWDDWKRSTPRHG